MGSDSETERSAKEKKKLNSLMPIAKPLAGKKLCKRTFKLVRKAAESKCLRRGVKEVVKSIRRNQKGILLMQGQQRGQHVVFWSQLSRPKVSLMLRRKRNCNQTMTRSYQKLLRLHPACTKNMCMKFVLVRDVIHQPRAMFFS